MRFDEIGDSDDSDSVGAVPASFATGIAERMKARASKKAPQEVQILAEATDESDLIELEQDNMPPSKSAAQEIRQPDNRVYMETETDDLAMFSLQQSSDPVKLSSSAMKRKNGKTKRALDEYEAPRIESTKTKRKSKREAASKKVEYTPGCDPEGNIVPHASHVEATPGLPDPVSASKSQDRKDIKSLNKQVKGSIKDSQSSPMNHTDRIVSLEPAYNVQIEPVKVSPLCNTSSQSRNPIDLSSDKPQSQDCHEEVGNFRLSKSRSRRKVLAISDDEEVETRLTRKADDISEDAPQSLSDIPKTLDADLVIEKIVGKGKRAKRRVELSDDSERETREEVQKIVPHAGDAVPPRGRKTKNASGKAREKKAAKIDQLKEEFQGPKIEVKQLAEIETEAPSRASPSLPEVLSDQPESSKLPEIKAEQPKVVNYAALAGKSPAIKLASGPRHRVGLSKKMRVEPLHANFVRK